MKIRKLLAVLSSFAILGMTGCDAGSFFNGSSNDKTSGQMSELYPVSDVQEHGIAVDSMYKSISESDGVLFETALNEEDMASDSDVGLYDENKNKVSDLYDDGTNGDKVAGDGIYACRYYPEVNSESSEKYTIKINDFETDPVDIRFFDDINESDFEESDKLDNDLKAAVSEFADSEGNISSENSDAALDKVGSIVEEMFNQGEVVSYSVNKNYNNVVVKLNSGITYVYENKIEGVDQAGKVQDISITTCQPCKAGYDSSLSQYMQYPDKGAKVIDEEFDHISFDKNLDDGAVTLNTVKNFGSNQIVLWHGHGGFTREFHSFIVTGDNASSCSNADLVEDRVIEVRGGHAAFTYKFVDAYVGDMSGSLIYIGCCQSGKDAALASSFINKGCNTVIVNSETIYTTYNSNMIYEFSKNLAREKKTFFFFNAGHRTAQEALTDAKKKLGMNDGSERNAAPYILGNSGYMLEDAIEGELEEVTQAYTSAAGSLSLNTTYISLAAGESQLVKIESYPEGYTASDFEWSVDKSSVATVKNGTVTGIGSGSAILTVKSNDKKYSQFCAINVRK